MRLLKDLFQAGRNGRLKYGDEGFTICRLSHPVFTHACFGYVVLWTSYFKISMWIFFQAYLCMPPHLTVLRLRQDCEFQGRLPFSVRFCLKKKLCKIIVTKGKGKIVACFRVVFVFLVVSLKFP